MKVSIDLTPCYSEHRFRGIGFYTKRLIEGLQSLQKKKYPNLELDLIKSIGKLRFLQTDLVHYPYFSPFFFSLPAKFLAPSLVTIHDLIPIKYSPHFPAGLKGRLCWQIQKKRLKKIKAVITDSQIWQKEIADLTGYPKDNIYAIPLAAGNEFQVIEDKNLKKEIKTRYNLPEKFILYVGDVNWNKNIEGLIKGFAELEASLKVHLVLVGKAFLNESLTETKSLLHLIEAFGLGSQVRRLGFIPTKDLVLLYNLAVLYCQSSFDEGFGLPVLEAMACGCPVVAARSGSLPEICGEATLMVDPQNYRFFAQGFRQILASQEKQEILRQKGFARVKAYSWEKTAEQTLEIYQKVYRQENV